VFLISGDTKHCYAETNRLSLVNILFFPKVLRLPLADLRGLPGYHVLFQVEPKLRRQHGFRGRLRLNSRQLAETSQLITKIEEEMKERSPGYRMMASMHLMHLICYLSRCYSSGKDSPDERPWMRLGEVLSHIENNYAQAISVEQLAEIACMSESSLMRSFQKVTGKSPIDYVISVRVSRAGELLERTDMNITEVAYACGFSDSNYFSRQFKRLRGCSPRAYRRRGQTSVFSE
jgi:AraC family L-rhamnose operon transcriptional activator RhaR/AraC family L-rhamnose operon regulatory protein RhaS